MKLNIGERLMLLQVLPIQGNVVTLRIVQELRGRLGLTEEDHKKFEIKEEDKNTDKHKVSWNKKGDDGTEVLIGERATDVIVDSLKNLDNNKKLIPQMMSLWDKFIEDKKTN